MFPRKIQMFGWVKNWYPLVIMFNDVKALYGFCAKKHWPHGNTQRDPGPVLSAVEIIREIIRVNEDRDDIGIW